MKAIVLAFAAICGLFAAPAGADAPEKTRVVLAVGGRTTPYFLPLTLGARLGYFQDEGLAVGSNAFPRGPPGMAGGPGPSPSLRSRGPHDTNLTPEPCLKRH